MMHMSAYSTDISVELNPMLNPHWPHSSFSELLCQLCLTVCLLVTIKYMVQKRIYLMVVLDI